MPFHPLVLCIFSLRDPESGSPPPPPRPAAAAAVAMLLFLIHFPLLILVVLNVIQPNFSLGAHLIPRNEKGKILSMLILSN